MPTLLSKSMENFGCTAGIAENAYPKATMVHLACCLPYLRYGKKGMVFGFKSPRRILKLKNMEWKKQ